MKGYELCEESEAIDWAASIKAKIKVNSSCNFNGAMNKKIAKMGGKNDEFNHVRSI